jgi:hypothetical protein
VTAALLAPLYRSAKAAAGGSDCMERLHFLGRQSLLYANDYDGHLMEARRWTSQLRRNIHLMEPDLLTCVEGPGIFNSYAMLESISGRKVTELPDVANQLMLFDSKVLMEDVSGSESLMPNPPRHSGMNVAVFADGHTGKVKR